MTAPFYKNYQSSAPVYQQGPQIPQAPSSNIPTTGGGSGADWLSIIQGIGQGAASGMSQAPAAGGSLERKRRNMANLLSQALKRELDIYRMQGQQGADNAASQSAALNQGARGFTNSLHG